MVPRFLLVSLSIAAILGEATIHKRRERLDVMTNGLGLDGAYDATLDRIKGQGKGKSALAMAALMWISRSERPMQIGELCDALGVEIGSQDMKYDNIPSEKTLLASCLGLVTVDESSTVRLVHFTLQEYFNSHSEHFDNPQSTMAEVCLTYLNFDSINELSHSLDSAPVEMRLLQYASSYWGLYASNGLTEGMKLLALRLLGKFGRHISAKLLLTERYGERWISWRYSEGFTGLHCVAYLGLDEIAIALLEEVEGSGADMVDGLGRTPLVWAVESGHKGMVKLLLDRKEVNPDSRDDDGETPLWHAAEGGHENIVKLLLDQKNVNPDPRGRGGRTALWCAALGGHEGVVKLLLGRKEVNPDSKDNNGLTALWCAASDGYARIVKLLLDRKEVNPDPRSDDGQTALWCAASGGHERIVKLLLDREEVNPDWRDNNGETPLLCAALGGHEGIVRLLLDRYEVNPDSGDPYGQTPLFCAAYRGYEGIVRLLLDRKEVNPDSSDNSGQTPLWQAAWGGYEGIAKLLLDRKEVNPDPTPWGGRTALWCAANGGHEGILKLLLDRKEVNPDSRDDNGETPLLCAAKGGHEEIVKLLLDREEVNPDSRDKDGQTPLWCAAKGGHDGIVKLLLDRIEVNPDSRDKYGRTLLGCAADAGHEGIVKLLRGRADTESGTGTNDASMPPSYPPLNSPPLALPNYFPRTAIAACLAIEIWLQALDHQDSSRESAPAIPTNPRTILDYFYAVARFIDHPTMLSVVLNVIQFLLFWHYLIGNGGRRNREN